MQYDKRIQDVIDQAKVVSREELLQIFEQDIKNMENYPYYNYRYEDFQRERESQKSRLAEFDAGKKVVWLKSYDHFGYGTWGEDTITRLYTDGSWQVETHLAD